MMAVLTIHFVRVCVCLRAYERVYIYIYSHHNVWLNKCVCISWSACSADTHTCSMRVCVHLWHALRRPSADSGLWRTTKLALLSTAVKTSIREQRHSWLVSESLSFALCSQAKWLERFNQQRHWKDSYLPAFHLAHSSSLTAALAFPSSTTYLRDRHFPSKDKYGKDIRRQRHSEGDRERETYDGMNSIFQQRESLSWQTGEQSTGVVSLLHSWPHGVRFCVCAGAYMPTHLCVWASV